MKKRGGKMSPKICELRFHFASIEYFGTFFSIAVQAADDHRLSIDNVNLEEQLFGFLESK